MAEQGVILNSMQSTMRITDDRPLGLRWKGGVLQYMRHWSDGERQGHEWVDVPTEPADEDGVGVPFPAQPQGDAK